MGVGVGVGGGVGGQGGDKQNVFCGDELRVGFSTMFS